MKKTLIMSIILAVMFSFGVTHAEEPVNLDTLEKTFLDRNALQANYLNALKTRYRNMYNRRMMDSDYRNVYNQRLSIQQAQKAVNIIGQTKSILSRVGRMEQDKERVRRKTDYQTKAVNFKSVFLKRAMDYYVYNGYAGTDIMETGNISMDNHKISRTRMFDLMHKHRRSISDITANTRQLQKSMAGHNYAGTKIRQSTYRTGDFYAQMISPFTSLKWLEN